MLVCSVVLRPRHVTVAADMIETATAFDDPHTVMLFGTLLDSPGDAKDILDGFVGQEVKEDATATATVSAAMAYKIAVLEDTTAREATLGLVVPKKVVTAAMLEAASATATQDATGGGAAARVANLNGVFVDPQAPATVIGTDDSGPITVVN